jgi:hypothetical protein
MPFSLSLSLTELVINRNIKFFFCTDYVTVCTKRIIWCVTSRNGQSKNEFQFENYTFVRVYVQSLLFIYFYSMNNNNCEASVVIMNILKEIYIFYLNIHIHISSIQIYNFKLNWLRTKILLIEWWLTYLFKMLT